MSSEFIVKIRANSRKELDSILCDGIESKHIDSFYILTENNKSLAHLHTADHMWVERIESEVFATTAWAIQDRIEGSLREAGNIVESSMKERNGRS